MSSNIYKLSTRDDVKYITQNGVIIEAVQPYDWGWYGSNTFWTAFKLLSIEYGYEVANLHASRFAREYLANMTCDNFVLTSGVIDAIIRGLETKE